MEIYFEKYGIGKYNVAMVLGEVLDKTNLPKAVILTVPSLRTHFQTPCSTDPSENILFSLVEETKLVCCRCRALNISMGTHGLGRNSTTFC